MPLQTDFDCDSLPLQRFAWARFGAVQLLLLPAPASCSSLCCFSLSRSSLAALLFFSRCDSVRAPLSGSALFMPQYIDIYICIYILLPFYIYVCTIYITCSQSHLFVLYCIFFLFFRLYPLIALTAWAFYFALEIISTFCFPHTHAHTHGHCLKTAAASLSRKNPAHSLAPSLSLSSPAFAPLSIFFLRSTRTRLNLLQKKCYTAFFTFIEQQVGGGGGGGENTFTYLLMEKSLCKWKKSNFS